MSAPSVFDVACRQVVAHPVRWLLVGAAIAALTFAAAVVLLVSDAIARTADRVLERGPALVVSRVDAGGWAAIAASDATIIAPIPGVQRATPRIWGILPGPPTVTIVADPGLAEDAGVAVAGQGVQGARTGATLVLRGLDGRPEELRVARMLAPQLDVVAFDIVFVAPAVAQRLLLLESVDATDIAVDSVRDEENDALVRAIAEQLPRPVRVTTRAQMRGAWLTQAQRRTGLGLVAMAPSILALVLVVAVTAAGGEDDRRRVGKLKLVGWTTSSVARLYLLRMGLVAGAAVALGLSCAYLLVFPFGLGQPVLLALGWDAVTPHLLLDAQGAAASLLWVGAFALAPCLVAAVIPVYSVARTDPAELLEAP
jgi:ABC-type lipoprotein release transport system permease subunit